METLHFGLQFDSIVHLPAQMTRAGERFLGPKKLLHWLETHLGLGGYPENTDYLRIELYRQALGQYLQETDTKPFFADSFEADRFATATTLLTWRDELLLAGWNFETQSGIPERLATFSHVEQIFRKKWSDPELKNASTGWADRFHQAIQGLEKLVLPITKCCLYEPLSDHAPHIRRLMQRLADMGIPIEEQPATAAAPQGSELRYFQDRLLGSPAATPPVTDKDAPPPIVIMRARSDSQAATALAQFLRENTSWTPHFLIPEMNLLLAQSLEQEGFPAMGILSASLARPSLQVLKLAPVFLWEPVDVFKVMEFLTLPLKPFDAGLSLEMARVMAERPGLFSDAWFATAFGYLENADLPPAAREQYEFWFDRRRYPMDRTAPKRDAIALYAYLQHWARDYYEENGSTNPSLMVLSEQARRIHDLLEALPEQQISFLELERIVRTIYEPSPTQMSTAELGHFRFVHQPGAFAAPVEHLVWWNCLMENVVPPPEKWRNEERAWLSSRQIELQTGQQKSRMMQRLQLRPVLQASESIVLVVPEQADGAEVVPSLLLGDLEAAFGQRYRDFNFHLNQEDDLKRLAQWFRLADHCHLTARPSGRPKPQLRITTPRLIRHSEYETPTNLDTLFYYPHRWFFRQKLKIYPGSLLSISRDETLQGNLSHRFFEHLLLQPDVTQFSRDAVRDWIDAHAETLFPREGATLLLYGREPDRLAFLNKVKNAAWSLISMLKNNGWEVLHTEYKLEGTFVNVPVRGKADLILARGDERAIIDLKWSGLNRRKELIINGEDLQLVLYAHLLPPPEQWPHTAYFILKEGKMVARNALAFKEAIVAGNMADHGAACEAILSRMQTTYRWRQAQFANGQLEVRNSRTALELEHLYEGHLFDLLEMKNEDDRWDEYRILLDR